MQHTQDPDSVISYHPRQIMTALVAISRFLPHAEQVNIEAEFEGGHESGIIDYRLPHALEWVLQFGQECLTGFDGLTPL